MAHVQQLNGSIITVDQLFEELKLTAMFSDGFGVGEKNERNIELESSEGGLRVEN